MLSENDFLNIVIAKTDPVRLVHKANTYYNKPDIKEFIDTNYSGKSVSEVAYILYYRIKETPTCKYCGKPLLFHDFIHGYRDYCNKSCAARDTNPDAKCIDMMVTKNTIEETFTDNDGNIIVQRCLNAYLKKHGWYNSLMSYYDDSSSCFETIYRILNDLDIRPVCEQCGKPLKFNHMFARFCSKTCSNKNADVLAKNAQSVSKALLKAYEERGDEIKEKRKISLSQKYDDINTSSPFSSKTIRDKANQSIKDSYGVNNAYSIKEVKDRGITSNRYRSVGLQKYRGYDIEYVGDNVLVKNGCDVHGDIVIEHTIFNNRTKDERRDHMTLCPICNPLRNPETSIEAILKNILNELGITYIQHDRKMIKPYELDFYLPDYRVGIECNGVFWHGGEHNKDKIMHKYELCKSADIKLLYFWENDIYDKVDIIKSYIQSITGKNIRVFARQCVVKEIDSKTSKDFIDRNHLQGNINASIKLGLFHNNTLVEVMTFGKKRRNLGARSNDDEYELYRLCSLGGYTVVGGASKLLKRFINVYKPKYIITYCSNDISSGNVYEKIGFTFDKECGQGYCYINLRTGERKNRFALRKDIVDDGSGRTETQINESNGWMKCYDTGNKKYFIKM